MLWHLTPHPEFLPQDLGAWNATPIKIHTLSPSLDLEGEFTAQDDFPDQIQSPLNSIGNDWQPPDPPNGDYTANPHPSQQEEQQPLTHLNSNMDPKNLPDEEIHAPCGHAPGGSNVPEEEAQAHTLDGVVGPHNFTPRHRPTNTAENSRERLTKGLKHNTGTWELRVAELDGRHPLTPHNLRPTSHRHVQDLTNPQQPNRLDAYVKRSSGDENFDPQRDELGEAYRKRAAHVQVVNQRPPKSRPKIRCRSGPLTNRRASRQGNAPLDDARWLSEQETTSPLCRQVHSPHAPDNNNTRSHSHLDHNQARHPDATKITGDKTHRSTDYLHYVQQRPTSRPKIKCSFGPLPLLEKCSSRVRENQHKFCWFPMWIKNS